MENSKRPKLHQVMNRAAENLIPLQVSVELTHRYNQRCKHCYVDVRSREICFIIPNGDVYPWLPMLVKIGNVRRMAFSELWKTNPCQELIVLRSISRSDMKECMNSNISQFCHLWPGVVCTETGSFTRPGPSACRNATFKFTYLTNREEVVL
ncbi:SPASM domain-containing protein [bacterium]|nr:SPASM domain-containing protein [bacterium]